MRDQRVKRVGVLARPCTVCGAKEALRVKEVQDLRRVGPFRVKDREPYRVARCTECSTVLHVPVTEPLA